MGIFAGLMAMYTFGIFAPLLLIGLALVVLWFWKVNRVKLARGKTD